jgi:hypothetical protein
MEENILTKEKMEKSIENLEYHFKNEKKMLPAMPAGVMAEFKKLPLKKQRELIDLYYSF